MRYDYTFEITDHYTDNLGYIDEADEGKTFVISSIKLTNDHYSDGLSTNYFTMDWDLKTTHGVNYSSSGNTIYHPGYQDVTVQEGSSITYTVVFEVPMDIVADDVKELTPSYLTLFDGPSFERDDSLIEEADVPDTPTPDTPDEPTYKPTRGESNALNSAKDYLSIMPGWSCTGLMEQLEYEGYTTSEQKYAVDNCGADWYQQAIYSAENYLKTMPMSKTELCEQLIYEGFTPDQANKAVDSVY